VKNTNIIRVDLRKMSRLRRTPKRFLASCSQLRLLNMGGLEALTIIQAEFAKQCSPLTSVTWRGMTALTTIGPKAFEG
jgi:hypothetical protein